MTRARAVLIAALVLGALGDALLRAVPWGLNLYLWSGILLTAVIVLAAGNGSAATRETRWLVIPAACFAATFAWRDTPILQGLNLLALLSALALLSVATLRASSGGVRLAGFRDYVRGALGAGVDALTGFVPLAVRDSRLGEAVHGGGAPLRHAVAAGRGLVITLPVLLGFTGLFMGADAVFARSVTDLVPGFDRLLGHACVAGLFAWLAGGYLRGVLLDRRPLIPAGKDLDLSLGRIETTVLLGMLNLLFSLFVVIQVRYLFGGAAHVQTATGLTYAEYARRGFFELVAASALVLPLLLFTHELLRRDDATERGIFRPLAGTLLLLLFVIMASALQRMRIYQQAYGLTQLRFYATAFMGWLFIVYLWFAATVLRKGAASKPFAFGAVVSGWVVLAALNVVNPDAAIARTNLARARAGRQFDPSYVARLGADAVPQFLAALPDLDAADRCEVARRVRRRWMRFERADWRTWNWARERARQAVREHAGLLRQTICTMKPAGGE